MTNPNQAILEQLARLTDGLWYMSETDAPLEVVAWEAANALPALSTEKVLQILQLPERTPIQQVSFIDFFENMTAVQDWFDDYETENAQRFQQLVKEMQTLLTDLQVFRIGDTEIEAYAVGKTPHQTWIGIKTQLTET